MPTGFAVVISTASAAMRSALSSISASSATSQPPVFGTPTKLRVLATSPTLARDVEGRRDLERLLLDVGAFAGREVLPLVGDADRRGDARHVLVLDAASTTFCTNACFSSCGDGGRVLLQRRRPVLGVGRHRRELHVRFLGDRARLRDFGGDARDAPDFVFGDDRAAGEAPDAAVNDADAEARGAAAARRARAPPPPPPRRRARRRAAEPAAAVAASRSSAARVDAACSRCA